MNSCFGEVSERLKVQTWKVCVGAISPRVRIPPSPFFSQHKENKISSDRNS